MEKMTRRNFIKTSGFVAGAAAGILSAKNVTALDSLTPDNGMQTIWFRHTEYFTLDPTLQISRLYSKYCPPSTIVTSKIVDDSKWISIRLSLPSNDEIKEVTICYKVSNPRSFISQIVLVEMPPLGNEIIRHDDQTSLNSTSPECYSSKISGLFVPTDPVTLELRLRLNFQDTSDKIILNNVGVKSRTTKIAIIPGDSTDMIQSLLNEGGDIYLKKGTYTITRPLKIPPRTCFRGEASQTMLHCDPQQLPDGPIAWLSNAPAKGGIDGHIEIINIALEMASQRPEQTGIYLGVGNTIPRSCRIAGIELSGTTRYGIRLERAWASVIDSCTLLCIHSNAADACAIMLADQAHGVTVRNCYLSSCDAQVCALNFNGLSIESNVFDSGGPSESQEQILCSGKLGSIGRGLTISSNYVEALRTVDGQHAIRLQNVHGADIRGNMFISGIEDNGEKVLTWGMLLIDTGCNTVRISSNCIEGETIQRAVTSLSPDTHIFVEPNMVPLVKGDFKLE